ncbi:hypothetical protein CJU89_3284 [Yarrowia sp. B02]|nr:hypothetical protein CJU89_3284 [Yarrowia sp. B02]
MSNTTGSDTVREEDRRPSKKQRRDSNYGQVDSGVSSEALFDATTEAEGGDIEDEKEGHEATTSEKTKEDSEDGSEQDRGRRRSRRQASPTRTKSREHSHSKSRSRSHKGEEHERRTLTKLVDGKEVRQHISRDRYHSRSVSRNEQTKSATDRSGHTSTTKDGSQRKDDRSHSRERVRVSMSPDNVNGESRTLEYERDGNDNVNISGGSDLDITPEDVDRAETVDESSYGYEKCDEREASRSRSRSREGSRDRERNRSRERNRGYERSLDKSSGRKDGKNKRARSRDRDESTSVSTISEWSQDSSGSRRSVTRKVVKHDSGEESRKHDGKGRDESHSVIATNLPGSATHAHVREIFERIGAVRNVDSMELSYRFRRRVNQYERSDQGTENNFMITYYNANDADEAVYRMHGSQVDHEVISVTKYEKAKRAGFKETPKERTQKTKQASYDTGWVSRGRKRDRSDRADPGL